MVIDFHTHCYPDELAAKALRGVDDKREGDADGTVSGLKKAMAEAGVDLAVLLPVCAHPGHERTVNAFASEAAKSGGLIPFFSVHPFSEGADELIRMYAGMGMKGVKFHPNMQRFSPRDPRLFHIWRAVKECGLIAVFHCGRPGVHDTEYDVYAPDFLPLLGILDPEKTVLAHTGGYGVSDDGIKILADTGMYTDLSLVPSQFDDERFERALGLLSPDRILFGSDSPWRDIKHTSDFIKRNVHDERTLEKILHVNAEKLLGI